MNRVVTALLVVAVVGCSRQRLDDIVGMLPDPSPAETNAAPVETPAPTVETPPAAPVPDPTPAPRQEFGLSWTHAGKQIRLEAWPLWASECKAIVATDAAGKRVEAVGIGGGGQKANATIYATLPIAPSALKAPVAVEILNAKHGVLRFEGINPAAQPVVTIRK